ncbi:phospholipase D family protein [Tabrizicola sp. BL-A-41-H6]|uniref:phospholipase D family protein n=1 Tax=Tabrizicola sp. BL-A-41-H6 TaxID=3421107 RepID=UPI003D66E943
MKLLRLSLTLLAAAILAVLALRLAFPLPDRQGIAVTTAIPASAQTTLGAAILPEQATHPGNSGITLLAGGGEAFAARVALARAAEQTLDVQYYIWQADTTGFVLLNELRAAAARGVRVRLLLDDNGITGLDAELRALDDLPNIELRLFNPFTLRNPKLLSFAFDFVRLNRRMHNKSLTADGVASVVGGRNVGDIYFAYGPGEHYIDTDVLAVGPAATDVSAMFDAYWNSASAFPADLILPAAPDGLARLQAAVTLATATDLARDYFTTVSRSSLVARLMSANATEEWVPVTLVSDDPLKGLGRQADGGLLIERLGAVLTDVATGPAVTVDLVSAYFVPGQGGTDLMTALSRQGVAVRVLTNAQEATDVLTVHGSYAGYRDDLLAAGVVLGELKADPLLPQPDQTLAMLLAGSASSLHSKVFSIDNARVFIGSFNLDPRSARLNTEMGLLIESPAIAALVTHAIDRVMLDAAYGVRLTDTGALSWVTRAADGSETVLLTEPNTTWLDRSLVTLIGLLPIEWMM